MKQVAKKIHKFAKDRGWEKTRPSDVAKSIIIEGAELLEIFQWDNPTIAETRKDKERMELVKKELADVLIYGLHLATTLGIDPERAVLKKLEHNSKKYPAKLMREKDKVGRSNLYWEIKKRHRTQA